MFPCKSFISGSKTAIAINGKILPSASNMTYKKWLNENRKEKNVPNCDLDVYVDNTGKYIVKSYRVQSERNNSPNVITAVINIELQKEKNSKENIQYIKNLKPVYWQNNLAEPEIQKLMEKEIVETQNNFREYRYNYPFSLFKFLSASNDMDDLILKKISTLENPLSNRFCINWNKNYFNQKQKCDDWLLHCLKSQCSWR